MNKTKLDMSAIMADYIAKEVAEGKRRQAIREAVANGTYVPVPVHTTNWHISDRD